MPRSTLHFSLENHLLARPTTAEIDKRIKAKFGFFDGNYIPVPINPGLTPTNAKPKEEDYMFFVFRWLTATIVAAGTWKATDFSDEKLLKGSKNKLAMKPSYVNHAMEIGNHIGIIGNTLWVPSSTVDGLVIPGGIEAPLIVDSIKHPDICRDMLNPFAPVIQSTSLTVDFDWLPSHDFDDEHDFINQIGKMVNGTMVRRVATKIHNYPEGSLVWLGSDPFAKARDKDGKLINIERNAVVSSTSFDKDKYQTLYTENNNYHVVYCLEKDICLGLGKNYTGEDTPAPVPKPKPSPDKSITMDKEKLLAFAALMFGCKAEEVTEAMFGQFKAYKPAENVVIPLSQHTLLLENANKLPGLLTKVANLEAAVNFDATIKAAYCKVVGIEVDKFDKVDDTIVTQVTSNLTNFKKFMDARQAECIKLYKLKEGDKATTAQEDVIKGATYEKLAELFTEYGGAMVETFDATCTQCKTGDHIQLRSSVKEAEGVGDETLPSIAERHRS